MPANHNTPPTATDLTTPPAVWTEQRIRALGAITDLPTAGRIFGLGRAMSYELARTGDFPVPVLRVGTRYRVPVAGILAALGLPTYADLTTAAQTSVDHHDDTSGPHRSPTSPDIRKGTP